MSFEIRDRDPEGHLLHAPDRDALDDVLDSPRFPSLDRIYSSSEVVPDWEKYHNEFQRKLANAIDPDDVLEWWEGW